METHHNKLPILIIGGMGHLGSHITRHAVQDPTFLVNILTRDPKIDKELVTTVEKAGGKVLKGDICDSKTLKECTKGIHTVISALSSDDEKSLVDGQIGLMEICVENRVERVVPSDFSVNLERIRKEEITGCPTLKSKMTFSDHLSTTGCATPKILRIRNGIMMETLFEMVKKQGVGYYGDPKLKHDLTCCDDMAKFIVSAVSKRDLCGDLALVGCTETMEEIITTYNKVRGTKLECKRLGSLEDLKKTIEKKRKEGDMEGAEICSLLSIMYDPRSKFEKTHNSVIPPVKTVSVEEFLRTHPEITLE